MAWQRIVSSLADVNWDATVPLVCLLIIILVLVVKKALKEEAAENYRSALADLRKNPENQAAHERALELGRLYSRHTKHDLSGIRDYDELAMQYDLKIAGCAAPQGQPPKLQAPTDLALQLKNLADLHAQGVLSDDEFAVAKSRVLAD